MGLMTISFVVAAILVMLSFFGGSECNAADSESKEGGKAGKPAEAATKSTPAKTEVLKKLKKLADTQPPKKLSPGAMCYDMAAPPMRAEYVCPTCNEKTLYINPKGKWGGLPQFVSWELQACRRTIKKIKGLKVSLDESALCKKCKPNAKKNEVTLVVDYGDPKALHKVAGITMVDLTLLSEFLDGKLKHDGGQGGEVPLKKYVGRLETLLGVKLDSLKKTK
jgi:hypothetical protein